MSAHNASKTTSYLYFYKKKVNFLKLKVFCNVLVKFYTCYNKYYSTAMSVVVGLLNI